MYFTPRHKIIRGREHITPSISYP